MSYFNCIDAKQIKDLSPTLLLDYLIDKEIYVNQSYQKKTIKADNLAELFNSDGVLLDEIATKKVPVQEVLIEYYNFLKDFHKADILFPFLQFCKKFESDTFGLSFDDKKPLALKVFNQIFDDAKITRLYDEKESGFLKEFDRFKLLSYKRKAVLYSLENDDVGLLAFLVGNLDYFKTNNPIDAFLIFERNAQFLVALNSEFNFTDSTLKPLVIPPKPKQQIADFDSSLFDSVLNLMDKLPNLIT